ncbi:hypothetical protein HPB47_001452 [Ixodes persulcatus]|uniref:Uncharacterized protein n=1 Tax=Ixodes persulcatus TaxID=34615 RepID=A0AC60PNZ6_IXOPE|nr:hypothetical protein HPB47_001452 [Ixodes persulcatus]
MLGFTGLWRRGQIQDDSDGLVGGLFSLRRGWVIFSATAAEVRFGFVEDIGPVSYSSAVEANFRLPPEGMDPKDVALRYRLELDPISGLVTRVHLLGRNLSLGLRQSFAAYLHEFSTQAELSGSGHYVFSAYRSAYQLDEQVAYHVLKAGSSSYQCAGKDKKA